MSQFNIDRAIQDLQELSYPRFVGTDGEKKAAEYIRKKFEETGLEVSEEGFTYSLLPFKFFRKAGHILQACLILLAAYFVNVRPILSGMVSIFLFVVLCVSTQWSKFLGSSLSIGTDYPSQNIVASEETSGAEKEVILMAHYDTKSQFIPMSFRIPIITISILGGMVFSLGIISSSIATEFLAFSIPRFYFVFSGLILSALTVLLVFNRTGNESPGVVDNASGVAVMLDLARVFSRDSPENLDIKFVATSAEEIGLLGAVNFLEDHRKELTGKNVFLINLDVLGSGELTYNSGYGLPMTRTSQYLNSLLEKIAEEKDISIEGKYVPTGLAADHMPFVENGFEATWLHSSMSNVHTGEDNLKQINKNDLENAGIMVQELICKISED